MQRRYQAVNIPTEIMRTVVAISETGSYSKAGERLLLSQPAITSQMKRLQILAGGAVFERTPFGVAPTKRGEIVIAQARKVLEANDQILSLGGATKETRAVRIGVSATYAERFVRALEQVPEVRDHASIYCDRTDELAKLLTENYVDVALMQLAHETREKVVAQWMQEYVWVRSRGFVLSPGAPLPVVGHIGDISSTLAIEALEDQGLAYRMAFTSPGYHARLLAVAASVGLMAVPRACVPADLVVATEYYLPKLRAFPVGICIRSEAPRAEIAPVIRIFETMMGQSAELAEAATLSPR